MDGRRIQLVNFQIEALKEITEKVADLYVSQIQSAGPLLGVLKIKA